MDHAGLASATSIATTIATILMFYSLKKKIGLLGILSYIKCGLKAGLASAIMGVLCYVFKIEEVRDIVDKGLCK